mmetsp:Transcript_22951/g.39353  ORF Transcript_22951/g.39353 Transcript_22951/m.39353 type:complete len:301 (+) Transcript_22951:38-940(+)|eukprot:CAMPEP_0196661972 /NCGR_PEP_ID=MMETSP1086-20130531/46632_1 /TAXON_ID=77921 /ORGANISM="Cyanoptyche  gloeocystis , Strain SAG4.97" /LENGTH=300 /DNA_ID=CAMNT_0041997129 /DNA_START=25 /DNA_END=927 /DNA_ORIENTATION=-
MITFLTAHPFLSPSPSHFARPVLCTQTLTPSARSSRRFLVTMLDSSSLPNVIGAEVRVFQEHDSMSKFLADYIIKSCKAAVARHDAFTVAFSGGSLPGQVSKYLVQEPWKSAVDWSKWHVYWADERCVPHDHPDSNVLLVKQVLFDKAPIPASQIFAPKTSLAPAACAADYAEVLKQDPPMMEGGMPRFDLMLLGMGPDGHTASLFPHHPLVKESSVFVAPIFDSPKPPPERITLTLPVLNNSREVMFISTGASKAEKLQEILQHKVEDTSLPSQLVVPTHGSLLWVLDAPAAALLSSTL